MDKCDVISISSTSSIDCEVIEDNSFDIKYSSNCNDDSCKQTLNIDNSEKKKSGKCVGYCNCGDRNLHSPVDNDNDDEDDGLSVKSSKVQQNGICIRYDFKNNDGNKIEQESITDYTKTTPLFRYIEDSKQNNCNNSPKKINNNNNHQLNNGVNHVINTSPKRLNTLNINPLSPESQKKEFCSYLQLMNPSDRKQIYDLKNRRSKRVKNLDLMKEKKKIERDLNSSNNSSIDSNSKNTENVVQKNLEVQKNKLTDIDLFSCSLKSLEKLNMQLGDDNNENKDDNSESNKNKKIKLEEESIKINKYLPLPPEEFYKKIIDFDEDIQELLKDIKTIDINKKIIDNNVDEKPPLIKNNKKQENGKLKLLKQIRKRKLIYEKKPKKEQLKKVLNTTNKLEKSHDNNKKQLKQTKSPITTKSRILLSKSKKPKFCYNTTTNQMNNFKILRDSMWNLNKVITRSQLRRRSVRLQNKKTKKTKFVKKLLIKNKKIIRDKEIKNPISISNDEKIKKEEEEIKTTDNDETKIIINNSPSRCEIVTIYGNSEDENDESSQNQNIEIINNDDDDKTNMVENWLRNNSSSGTEPACSLSPNKDNSKDKIFQVFDLSKTSDKDNIEIISSSSSTISKITDEKIDPINILINQEHDYFMTQKCNEDDCNDDSDDSDDTTSTESCSIIEKYEIDATPISVEIQHVDPEIKQKSLHRSLVANTNIKRNLVNGTTNNWDESLDVKKKSDHIISITKENGKVLYAYYVDHRLIITQEYLISLWTQSALGNILGAQNMWLPNGNIQRLLLNNTYEQKNSLNRVISTETSVAYVELWTKEHISLVRERPISDVFATVYFWRYRQSGLDKKSLQLENINASSSSVQYVVLQYIPTIIVSWQQIINITEKKSFIRAYILAADYQTVGSIREFTSVTHQISSLHNIEDCDNLVLGCGENRVSLWDVHHGYLISNIDLSSISPALSTFWAKCDRGFLFIVQESTEENLRLIAINGINHSWKRLQTYNSVTGFEKLRGVCIENGILVAFYSQGILCWNAQTGEPMIEEVPNNTEYIPSGKYVIMIIDGNIIVKHALTHFITADDLS